MRGAKCGEVRRRFRGGHRLQGDRWTKDGAGHVYAGRAPRPRLRCDHRLLDGDEPVAMLPFALHLRPYK